ncbi:MAG TPA: T9SS type A sorting domain-containing protein, partial [Bacteroidales bacterium]|nr:T9SS type A sorting domain-containing protein [Bacteroidales bacterium]
VKQDISLLPDVDGNGGEVTILNGEAPLYTLTLVGNGISVTVTLYDISYNPLTNPLSGIEAGTQFYFNTTGIPPSGTFVNWTDQTSTIVGTDQFFGPYTMPASDMIITANWSSGTKGTTIIKGEKSLYASLTINPGASLTVDKLFNENDNGAEAILVKSDENGTGYLIHNNAGVPATVERYLSQGKYHYVSSPIADGTQSILYGTLGVDDFYEWVETTREWINLNHPDNYNATGVLPPAKGYAVAYAAGDITKVFAGILNTGSYNFDATYTPGESSPYWNQRGFNLTGNPYPAMLDADMFLEANTDVYGLYFWDEAAEYEGERDDYATYSLAGGVGTSQGGNMSYTPDGAIAPMQGFIAQVKSDPFAQTATKTITYNNEMRGVEYSYFYKEQEDRDRIWLSVTSPEEDYNEILVAFMEGAEMGMDRTDAEKLRGNSMLALYSILEGGDFVIQGLPMLDVTESYEIPLGLYAGIAGEYTFDVQMIENFDASVPITLEDRLTNQFVNLRTTPQYIAQVAEPGEIRDRFFLHFNGATSVPVIDQKLTKVYAMQNQIIIQHVESNGILDVDVINTLGQTIISTPVNASEITLTVPGHNVVYIVKVRTAEGIESHKLLIR